MVVQFLNLWDVFVNEVSGTQPIFVALSILVITFFGAYLRLPNQIILMILGLWLLLLSYWIAWLLPIVALCLGVGIAWALVRLLRG